MSMVEASQTETTDQAIGSVLTLECSATAWNPEVHDFYGDAETILSKIDAMKMGLGDRRVYTLLVESADAAEVRFFEQVDAANWAVFTWHGSSLGDLSAKLSRRMLDNQGVHCIGEQVKTVITDTVSVELRGVVPAPASPRAAFAHPLRAYGPGTFMRATVALLC